MSCKHDFKLRSIGSVYTCTKCDMDVSVEMMQQLQQAHRQGWEQAKREAISAVKSNPILYPAHVDGGIAGQYVIDSVAVDAIAAMEYKGKAND